MPKTSNKRTIPSDVFSVPEGIVFLLSLIVLIISIFNYYSSAEKEPERFVQALFGLIA